ncbi:hypothetical protein [Wenxinia marina]|uniref:Uncharacterized protein n=1 Tax=Wenxinia marina DSM 24838 TaxID=1123501 RepID=A0A0D0QFN6_9RHOB|nr:hypothetical protein [Wenxinia marina]KIQ69833.1 hypothetical protein Wenmar_01403 [Wenxinia marina DSM 24838]
MEALAQAVLLVFTILLAWKVFGRVESAYASGESTFDLRLPVWPLIAGIWAGLAAAVLTTAAGLVVLLTGGRLEGLAPQDDVHE